MGERLAHADNLPACKLEASWMVVHWAAGPVPQDGAPSCTGRCPRSHTSASLGPITSGGVLVGAGRNDAAHARDAEWVAAPVAPTVAAQSTGLLLPLAARWAVGAPKARCALFCEQSVLWMRLWVAVC